jgi:hypothetical protein
MSFLMSFSHLFFGLPIGLLNIGFHLYTFFLPFFLLTFDVNGQTNLIFVLLCNLLCSYILLIYLIHRYGRNARINILVSLALKSRVCFCRIILPGKAQQLTFDCCHKVGLKVEFHLRNLPVSFGQCSMY